MTSNVPSLLDCLGRLIASPSISSVDPALDQSNRVPVELLAGWLEDLGFSVELMPVAERPDKLNLIACAGQGDGGLVLAGHTDTVPCNPGAWSQDPFRLTERDGKLYGLGVTDMKGFFALLLEALRGLDPGRLREPLYVLATCDEESNMSGARALVGARRRLGRQALIGEPTGLKPVCSHKGIVMETIRLRGRDGHSSDPSLGLNALEGMNQVINALLKWRGALQQERRDPAFSVPVPTLNFGAIHGGDSHNRICAGCELSIDLRLLPGMELEDTRAGLRRTAMQAVDGTGLVVEFDPVFTGLEPLATQADRDIVRLAEELSGAPAGAVAFGTEAPYLRQLGMDVVVLGPGDIEQAHQADEYLGLDRIRPMLGILTQLIARTCMGEARDVV